MARKATPVVASLKGAALVRYISERKAAISHTPGLDVDIVTQATAQLQKMALAGSWELDHYDYPSLPDQPGFSLRPDHGARSFIPIPPGLRAQHNGKYQADKRWPGKGLTAWAHYLAGVRELVLQYASPSPAAEEAGPTELEIVQQQGDEASIVQIADSIFENQDIMNAVGSVPARKRLETHFNIFLAHLQEKGCTQMGRLNVDMLSTFRTRCLANVRSGDKAIKTVNDYLYAARRVLKWYEIFAHADIPRSYEHHLRDIAPKEVASLGAHKGRKQIGVAETVAMPLEAVRAFMKEAMKDPFEVALAMCSWNLAAGAGDLSALSFFDHSTANPTRVLDMDHRMFISWRGKNQQSRWVDRTEQNERYIRMMDHTHQALTHWLKVREQLVKDLTGQKALRERIENARRAHELRAQGRNWEEIAAILKISRSHLGELMKQPTNMRDYARSLAEGGHVLDAIVAMTGLAKSTVYGYTRDILDSQGKKPKTSRWAAIKPDENLVFFVPATGRPLVNEMGSKNYVADVFERICERAGIYRESDLRDRHGQPRPDAPKPPAGAFILPRNNGHYIFRRSAATIAGMLGEVSLETLQHFMGHGRTDQTPKYMKYPPADYRKERMTHHYSNKVCATIRKTDDPIQAMEDFFQHVFK